MIDDVPSPIDLRLISDAQAWEATALEKRPWRAEFFECFVAEIAASPRLVHRILELGSGPGFLAAELLRAFPAVSYVAFDFSAAMHELAKARLGALAARVQFVERSFREPDWPDGLGQFECVVTNQAVHELRHKRYATRLHEQVCEILAPAGFYLVSDHFAGEGGMRDDQLYMSVEEQQHALHTAGFSSLRLVLRKGGMVLHRATRAAPDGLLQR
jgi:SAM-dependent methyltransferase